jgi:hypothetical protein
MRKWSYYVYDYDHVILSACFFRTKASMPSFKLIKLTARLTGAGEPYL